MKHVYGWLLLTPAAILLVAFGFAIVVFGEPGKSKT